VWTLAPLLLDYFLLCIHISRFSLVNDLKQRALALSEHVSAALGGTITEPKQFESSVRSEIDKLKARDPDQSVSLANLIAMRLGVCRHRSILFKYLCDHMHRFPAQWGLRSASDSSSAASVDRSSSGDVRGAIPCQLVRGVLSAVPNGGSGEAKAENHMWNVVLLGHELFVVDAMQRPGQLLASDSKDARAYQRAILLGAQTGVHSTQVHFLKVEC
jgi:hypothetical protein